MANCSDICHILPNCSHLAKCWGDSSLCHLELAGVGCVGDQAIGDQADACTKGGNKGFKCKIKNTERQNENSEEHGDDVAADIVAGVLEGDAAAVFKLLEAAPTNDRGLTGRF